MHKEVRTIKPTEPASTAKELFRRYDINHLVVVDRKNVIGMVADRDLIDIGADTPVQRAMAHPPVTISPDETVRKAAAIMTGHVIGSLPVVDDGKLVGIVTTFDLVALLAKGATRPGSTGERPSLSKRGPRKKPGTGRDRR
jgi:CBS domain-containing protein